MGIQKLIPIAVSLAFLVAATGQLPQAIKALRIAQLQLIKDSQASKWGMPMIPPNR